MAYICVNAFVEYIRDLILSIKMNTAQTAMAALNKKQEQGKVLCILYNKAAWLNLLPVWGLQMQAEKWRNPVAGPRELPALRIALEIYLELQQKEASFAGRTLALSHEKQETEKVV